MNRKTPLVIANRHAVGELQVFLRAMSAAQRHWGRKVGQQENNVRRLMMVEDHCREALKRNLLRSTHKNLKYLINTDLLTSAHEAPTPPPAETFLFYDIPVQQVSAFSMYAMSRLWADPERVDVPPLTLIADLQSTWAILPPAKRQAYEQLADIFRAHLDAEYTRRVAAEVAAESAAAAAKTRAASTAAKARKQRGAQRVRAARQKAARAASAAASPAQATKRQQQRQRRSACQPPSPSPLPSRAAPVTEAAAAPIFSSSSSPSLWETAAFENFAKESRRHMLATLRSCGAVSAGRRSKSAKDKGPLSAQQWLPIAQAEWATKSTRQKRSFIKEPKTQ